MKVSFFIYLSAAYILGVFSAASNNPLVWLGAVLFLLRKRPLIVTCLALGVALSAFAYYNYCDHRANEAKLRQHVGEELQGQVIVIEDIDPGLKNQKLSVAILSPNEFLDEKMLITTFLYPQFQVGDILEFRGRLAIPENWSEFRYDRYLARQKIYALMSYPHLMKVGEQVDWFYFLMKIKNKLYQRVVACLPEPEAGLAAALMLGYRNTITPEAKNIFAQTGLSHLIAISGSHLTLLASLLFLFLSRLKVPSRKGAYLVILFLWFYVILTGLSASALRSALMTTVVLISEQRGWRLSGGGLLVISAAIMLIHNPLFWRDDLGFQLSFLAMIALIYGQPIGEYYLGRGSVKSTLILTTMAQLLTWPISAANFGQASIVAPLANLLVTWTFVWLLPLLIANTLLSFVFSWSWLWIFTYFLLNFIFLISSFLAKLPGASLSFDISPLGMWIYYGVLFLIGRKLYLKVQKRAPTKGTLLGTSLKITT